MQLQSMRYNGLSPPTVTRNTHTHSLLFAFSVLLFLNSGDAVQQTDDDINNACMFKKIVFVFERNLICRIYAAFEASMSDKSMQHHHFPTLLAAPQYLAPTRKKNTHSKINVSFDFFFIVDQVWSTSV